MPANERETTGQKLIAAYADNSIMMPSRTPSFEDGKQMMKRLYGEHGKEERRICFMDK